MSNVTIRRWHSQSPKSVQSKFPNVYIPESKSQHGDAAMQCFQCLVVGGGSVVQLRSPGQTKRRSLSEAGARPVFYLKKVVCDAVDLESDPTADS